MRKRTIIVGLLVNLCLPLVAFAQCDSAGAWWTSEHIGRRLRLSNEQQSRLSQRFEAARGELRRLEAEVRRAQGELTAAMLDESSDYKMVDARIETLERARTALSKTRAHLLIDQRNVLHREQRRELARITGQRCREDATPRDNRSPSSWRRR